MPRCHHLCLLLLAVTIVHAGEVREITAADAAVTRVTKDPFFQTDVDIYHGTVVWIDLRHNEKPEWRTELPLHQPCI